MRLEKASKKAIDYACCNFHYSKSAPVNPFGLSVFNDRGDWCGCILYSMGANRYLGNPYDLMQGHVIELTRMALNGKQESTSRALSLSLRIIKKMLPLAKLVVSYADLDQNHSGVIYQATNWIYEGLVNVNTKSAYVINGKKVHPKTLYSLRGKNSISVAKQIDKNATIHIGKGKHNYLYVLDKSISDKISRIAKPYPKNAAEVLPVARQVSNLQEEFDSTPSLNIQHVNSTGSKDVS